MNDLMYVGIQKLKLRHSILMEYSDDIDDSANYYAGLSYYRVMAPH
jgi:hypothetical protein